MGGAVVGDIEGLVATVVDVAAYGPVVGTSVVGMLPIACDGLRGFEARGEWELVRKKEGGELSLGPSAAAV